MSKRIEAQYLQRGYMLPEVIDPEKCISVCVQIPDDDNHIRAFTGQIDMLGYWWTWERDSQKRGTQAAAIWRRIAECIREQLPGGKIKMTCCCEQDKQTRITDSGTIEVSTDGGQTWTPATSADDPRLSFPVIPMTYTGQSIQCQMASSATRLLQDAQAKLSNNLGQGKTAAELVVIILAALIFLEIISAGLLTAIIMPLVAGILGMSQATFDAAFSASVWIEIQCAIYCFTDQAGGEYSAADVESIRGRLQSRINPIAFLWVDTQLKLWREVLLTDAARSGFATDFDCSLCNCDCPYDLYAFGGATITYVGACTWEVTAVLNQGDGKYYASVSLTDGDTDINTCASATWSLVSGTNPNVTVTRVCGSAVNDYNAFHWHNSHFWSLVSNGAFVARFTIAAAY